MSKGLLWVAKISDNLGKLHEYEMSPRFSSIVECQEYIDKHLQDIESLLTSVFIRVLWRKYKAYKQWPSICIGGRFIRCYNLKQKRFADGFDF